MTVKGHPEHPRVNSWRIGPTSGVEYTTPFVPNLSHCAWEWTVRRGNGDLENSMTPSTPVLRLRSRDICLFAFGHIDTCLPAAEFI